MKTPEPVDKHVGLRVRMRRIELGLSQTALGEELGLTFQQVQKYEKGVNRIGAGRLQQIALILKVPVPYFFDGLNERTQTNSGDRQLKILEFASSPDGISLALAFNRIKDAKVRRGVVELVERLAERHFRNR